MTELCVISCTSIWAIVPLKVTGKMDIVALEYGGLQTTCRDHIGQHGTQITSTNLIHMVVYGVRRLMSTFPTHVKYRVLRSISKSLPSVTRHANFRVLKWLQEPEI